MFWKTKLKEAELANALPKAMDTACYIEALQTRVQNLEKSVLEVLRLEQKNDYQVYKEFQYKTWDKLPLLVLNYLMERYGFTAHKLGTISWLEECYKKPIKLSECIGESFDNYKLEFNTIEPNSTKIKRFLADFTSAQLSELMETIVDVINAKKEQEQKEKL